MKRKTAALALFAGIFFSVCGEAAESKSLTYCAAAGPDHFNPSLSRDVATIDAALPIYDGLVAFEQGGVRPVPALAQAWRVSEDGLVYEFFLRRGVAFHATADFQPTRDFNADDVLFTIERQWRADHPFHKVSGGGYGVFNDMGLPGLLKAVDKLDDYAVRFTLARPDAAFVATLAMPFAAIQSAEYAATLAARGTPEKIDQFPVGTGRFQLVDRQKGVSARYKAFDKHWAGRAPLDALIFSVTPDAAVRYAKLKVGDCQVAAAPNPADFAAMRQDPAVRLLQREGMNVSVVAFQAGRKPFDDMRVRRAVLMATDRAAVASAVFQGAGMAAKSLLPPGVWGYDDAVKFEPYNPIRAKELLAEAGYPRGFETELAITPSPRPYNPNPRRMAEMIQADLAHIGVKVKIVSADAGELRKRTLAGDYQMALLGWAGGAGDPGYYLRPLTGGDPDDLVKWRNKEFNDEALAAMAGGSETERRRRYGRAQEIIAVEAPAIPVAHSADYVAVSSKTLNYRMDPFGFHRFNGVDLAP